jgi:hypothetical protein
MDNPERHATLGIRHRTKTNKHQKHSTQNYKDEQHGPHQKQGGEHRGSQNTNLTKNRGGEHRGSQRVSSSYFFYIFVVAVSYIYLQVELGTRTEHVTSIFVFFVHIV